MFTVLKVRKDQAPNDYKNAGWFKQPKGTQAFEWKGATPSLSRSKDGGSSAMKRMHPTPEVELKVKKPSGSSSHNH